MLCRLAPLTLAAALFVLPLGSAVVAETTDESSDTLATTADSNDRPRNETNLSWAVCRVSWKIAWEVPGAGGLAAAACLFAIHADLEDYFFPGRP